MVQETVVGRGVALVELPSDDLEEERERPQLESGVALQHLVRPGDGIRDACCRALILRRSANAHAARSMSSLGLGAVSARARGAGDPKTSSLRWATASGPAGNRSVHFAGDLLATGPDARDEPRIDDEAVRTSRARMDVDRDSTDSEANEQAGHVSPAN